MPCLGRAIFGFGPPSVFWLWNHQRRPTPPPNSLVPGAFPLSIPWLFARVLPSQSYSNVSLLSSQSTLILSGYLWALWSTMARLAKKSWPFLWWSQSGHSHCHHLGLLFISLGVFSLFGHIPIIENQISQLEQITLRSLRTHSWLFWISFLMSGEDWAMKCRAKKSCPSGEEGST